MAKEEHLQKSIASTWFLDSYISRHLYNDHNLFKNTHTKSIVFVIAAGQIIKTNKIGTIAIPFAGGTMIGLYNIAFAP